jgi:hypothetical protein
MNVRYQLLLGAAFLLYFDRDAADLAEDKHRRPFKWLLQATTAQQSSQPSRIVQYSWT